MWQYELTSSKCDEHINAHSVKLEESQHSLMNKQRKSSKTKHSADSQNRVRRKETKDPSCNLNTHRKAHTLISFCIPLNEIISHIRSCYCFRKHIHINQSDIFLLKSLPANRAIVLRWKEVNSFLRDMLQAYFHWERLGLWFFFGWQIWETIKICNYSSLIQNIGQWLGLLVIKVSTNFRVCGAPTAVLQEMPLYHVTPLYFLW